MINNKSFTNIRVILDNCLLHELLQDLTLEQMVGYVIRFTGIFNIPLMYVDKCAIVPIEEYRGALPCDLIQVKQVKDKHVNLAIKEINGNFFNPNTVERAFKTQGQFIYTTFKDGCVEIAYRAIPIDEEGYPLILDNEKYKNALELFVKKDKFTKLFDQGKLHNSILQNVLQEYSWAAGQLLSELKTPSLSEWESISNAHNHLLQKTNEFVTGFETLGEKENFKVH